ncbi:MULTISPECIES: hypothetical protein [unclassified Treponema]|uniref:hypothetical protein n=1 Tax=unclassified Treponema TaxID=2638727 RepID=UPI0020A3B1EF|nr:MULTISPECIES: hypothetical protein [unclassified Treponema]UTC66175.1 hypothetical protein E4O06_09150 [Treponema sp. OMZ 789]UTC68904.1 hypothetical protein E4O01_09285 [Treponema sp. OMZ 790]UTC71632.1 hypothetical protein E4O02_09475 [Treponema sp. OMZ 791]
MKNIQRSINGTVGLILIVLLIISLVSCAQGVQDLKDYDLSEIYGYTFYGNITASSGTTLIPSFIIYDENRADWNMNVNGMSDNQFYYYAVKNSKANYTLYWFSAGERDAWIRKDKSKAGMAVQVGINSLDEIVILLTDDGLTDIEAMKNTRVPLKKQVSIPKNTDAPEMKFDPSIQDVLILVPGTALAADWEGAASYEGSFDTFVGQGGRLLREHGSCGKDSDGKEITPVMGITKGMPDSHTVTVKVHRTAAPTPEMSIDAFDIPDVQVFKDGNIAYLKLTGGTAQAKKLDGSTVTLNHLELLGKLENGKLTLRISFHPGKMPFPVAEVFRSK